MKQYYLLFVMTLLPSIVWGVNYFNDGMTWRTSVVGTHEPSIQPSIFTAIIEGDTIINGVNALKLYTSVDYSTKSLEAIVYTEGDKVYYYAGDASKEWILAYDFSLKEGEGCYVGRLAGSLDTTSSTYMTYVKCTGRGKCEDYGGLDAIYLEEYESDDCKTLLGSGIWLKGVGSTHGVMMNNCFEMDGLGSNLLMATSNGGEIICSYISTGISNVTNLPITIKVDGMNVYISNLETYKVISLYSRDGKLIDCRETYNDNVRMHLPHNGLYILKADECIYKFIVF